MNSTEIITEKFSKRLKLLMEEHNETLKSIGEAMNLSDATISRYINKKMTPKVTTVRELARYFRVNPTWLCGYDVEKYLANNIDRGVVEVPIIGNISDGEPLFGKKNISGYAIASGEDMKSGQYFFLKVRGDSMTSAGIYEGDLVLIQTTCKPDEGDICAVLCNSHEITLRRIYYQNGNFILKAENPDYKPMIVDKEEARIIGKAIKVQRNLE